MNDNLGATRLFEVPPPGLEPGTNGLKVPCPALMAALVRPDDGKGGPSNLDS